MLHISCHAALELLKHCLCLLRLKASLPMLTNQASFKITLALQPLTSVGLWLPASSIQHQSSRPCCCLQAPTASPLLEGRWRLLFTTRPGTASPIQRTFTGVNSFTVYQEILFSSLDGPRVNNIVDLGPKVGFLKASR